MDNEEPQTPALNSCSITTDGVVVVTLFLQGEAGLAKALGSLEMAKDLIKEHCAKVAMREAALRARDQIIRPGLAN